MILVIKIFYEFNYISFYIQFCRLYYHKKIYGFIFKFIIVDTRNYLLLSKKLYANAFKKIGLSYHRKV